MQNEPLEIKSLALSSCEIVLVEKAPRVQTSGPLKIDISHAVFGLR